METEKKRLIFILTPLFLILLLLIIAIGKLSQDEIVDAQIDPSADPGMTVTFLDIGQGDATFIRFADGQQMLVDCAVDARITEALSHVMPFYDHTIDYLVVTHPDKDHYGGCIDVLNRFEVGHIVYNGFQKTESKTWWAFFDAVKAEHSVYTQLRAPEKWTIASSTVFFLYPDHDITIDPTIPGQGNDDSNNTSIVMKVSYGEIDVLLTGDTESELEEYLESRYGKVLDVDILKVGHHGSKSSSTGPFLSLVTPEVSVISVGEHNAYGHPSLRVIRRLERTGSSIQRTDEIGDIVVDIFDNRYIFAQ